MVAALVWGMTTQLVSGVVIGVVVAVASSWVSHLLILRRERELWKREDMRKDNDELREVCARFLAICDSIWNERFSTGVIDEASHRELRFRWIEMRLIAPEEVRGRQQICTTPFQDEPPPLLIPISSPPQSTAAE